MTRFYNSGASHSISCDTLSYTARIIWRQEQAYSHCDKDFLMAFCNLCITHFLHCTPSSSRTAWAANEAELMYSSDPVDLSTIAQPLSYTSPNPGNKTSYNFNWRKRQVHKLCKERRILHDRHNVPAGLSTSTRTSPHRDRLLVWQFVFESVRAEEQNRLRPFP